MPSTTKCIEWLKAHGNLWRFLQNMFNICLQPSNSSKQAVTHKHLSPDKLTVFRCLTMGFRDWDFAKIRAGSWCMDRSIVTSEVCAGLKATMDMTLRRHVTHCTKAALFTAKSRAWKGKWPETNKKMTMPQPWWANVRTAKTYSIPTNLKKSVVSEWLRRKAPQIAWLAVEAFKDLDKHHTSEIVVNLSTFGQFSPPVRRKVGFRWHCVPALNH